MAGRRIRQHCKSCAQLTTHVKQGVELKCLCCESAKFRSQQATQAIKKKNSGKKRFDLNF